MMSDIKMEKDGVTITVKAESRSGYERVGWKKVKPKQTKKQENTDGS